MLQNYDAGNMDNGRFLLIQVNMYHSVNQCLLQSKDARRSFLISTSFWPSELGLEYSAVKHTPYLGRFIVPG